MSWIEFLKTLLFWSVLIGVIGFALFQYLQQNQELWQAIRRFHSLSSSLRDWEICSIKPVNL
jgi:hypothetical protein